MVTRSSSCLRLLPPSTPWALPPSRSLVSPAFQCQQDWDQRLNHEILIQVKKRLGEIFVELDRKFVTEMRGSAVDVDVFANAASSETELEQLEELMFKLRRTPHTVHTSTSTHHATVRAMLGPGASSETLAHLVRVLEDRTNYGLFLDKYTAVLLLDRMVEGGGTAAQGARVASQLMLQEEEEPTGLALATLACWRYVGVREQEPWLQEEEEEQEQDPEDVVRIRVREGPPHFGMVPNNYQDDHFDLREPSHILGKTLWYCSKGGEDPVSKSLTLLGLVLWGRLEQALALEVGDLVEEVCQEVTKISNTDGILAKLNAATKISLDMETELLKRAKGAVEANESSLVEEQKKLYAAWNSERDERLRTEDLKLKRKEKMDAIIHKKEELTREEEGLFFFDNQMRLDQEKEDKVRVWLRSMPARTFPGTKGHFDHPKWHKVEGKEIKVPRWKKVELKKGPPK